MEKQQPYQEETNKAPPDSIVEKAIQKTDNRVKSEKLRFENADSIYD